MLALGAMVAGIIMLIFGGNWTIDGAVYVARRFGISPLIVGFTIVAFGTSLPELLVSMIANFQGSAGIALGNVIGSNIANVLLVIGAAAIFSTLQSKSRGIARDLVMMLVVTAVLAGLMLYGEISRLAGIAMVLVLVSYVFWQYRTAAAGDAPMETEEDPQFSGMLVACGFLLMGLVGIAVGAEFLVRGAKVSASILGVPEAVIALSVIALGTSLPELSTSVIAGRKGHSEIVLGNIIGSNVFNILMIIGLTALAKPIGAGSFEPQLVDFDIWVAGAASVVFSVLLLGLGKIPRAAGFVFVSLYVLYNIYIYGIYIASL